MSPQQQRSVIEAFNSRTYFGGMGAFGTAETSAVGSGLLAAAPLSGPAAPFLAAAGALTTLIGNFFHPDMTKVEATNIVNKIEAEYLKPNLAAWQALPPNQKTQSAQAAAINVFNTAWNAVVQACSAPALGTAGVNCIGDRQRGSTKGYDWFKLYLDPIQNDPNAVPDSSLASAGQSISSSISSLFGGTSVASPVLPLIAGAILLYALFGMGD